MNRARLEARLREAFDPSRGALRVVVRQAGDLAESGRYEADAGRPLTAEEVLDHLRDAPATTADGPTTLVDRWNWWVGSLELAYGGYSDFEVRRWSDDADRG